MIDFFYLLNQSLSSPLSNTSVSLLGIVLLLLLMFAGALLAEEFCDYLSINPLFSLISSSSSFSNMILFLLLSPELLILLGLFFSPDNL